MENGILVLVGSAKPQARAQVERLADEGALVLTLSRQAALDQDETLLMGLRSGAAAALKQGRHVVVRSENWPEAVEVTRRLAARRGIPANEIERRVCSMLARVGEGVIKAIGLRRIVAVGTETGTELCRQMGLRQMVQMSAVAPGLNAQLAPGAEPLLLVLAPGEAGEPDVLGKAIRGLSDLPIQGM